MWYVPFCWISRTTKISSVAIPGMLDYKVCGIPTETGVNKEASLGIKILCTGLRFTAYDSFSNKPPLSINWVWYIVLCSLFVSLKGVRDRASKRLFTNAILQPGPGKFPEPSQKIASATANRYLMFWVNHMMSEVLKQQGAAATEYSKYQGRFQDSCDHIYGPSLTTISQN